MITETVLEMHYHKALMDVFRETYGLGENGSINFYKYSQQKECFVGFDQAYAKSELTESDFFAQLEAAASNNNYRLNDQFVGYFLQFKVVKELVKRSRYTPSQITSKSHYRCSLDTTKNVNTGLSQHELLFNLNKNLGAMVYYACPMLFDRTYLYAINADLETLRLVDLDSCPGDYTDNDNHYIFFNDNASEPIWCSEPVVGRALNPRTFYSDVLNQRANVERRTETASELLKVLTEFESAGVKSEARTSQERERPTLLPYVGEALTVIKISRNENDNS